MIGSRIIILSAYRVGRLQIMKNREKSRIQRANALISYATIVFRILQYLRKSNTGSL